MSYGIKRDYSTGAEKKSLKRIMKFKENIALKNIKIYTSHSIGAIKIHKFI